MKRTQITQDYSIPPVLKGGWQLAGDHGAYDKQDAIDAMFAYFDAGLNTFDCADIYTGVEKLIGEFRSKLKADRGNAAAQTLQVHTKYVPDRSLLSTITEKDTRKIIERSLNRLGVERLDLVQFHWWDFNTPGYVQTALVLKQLQKEGKIRNVGVTNFDTEHLDELISAGVPVATNQVQFSVFDRRPERAMIDYAKKHDIHLLCYGTLAGGLLSPLFMNRGDLTKEELASNRSYVKYRLIIEEIGGWDSHQQIMALLHEIAVKHNTTPSVIASAYILTKERVGAVIVGAKTNKYLSEALKMCSIELSRAEIQAIDTVTEPATRLEGPIYWLERATERHAGIMKYELNKE